VGPVLPDQLSYGGYRHMHWGNSDVLFTVALCHYTVAVRIIIL